MNRQLVDCKTNYAPGDFFQESVAVMLNDEVLPFRWVSPVFDVSIEEISERVSRDDRRAVVVLDAVFHHRPVRTCSSTHQAYTDWIAGLPIRPRNTRFRNASGGRYCPASPTH